MRSIILFFTFFIAGQTFAQTITKRPLKPSDVYRLQNLSSAYISPDGNWVAYALSTVDSVKKQKKFRYLDGFLGRKRICPTYTYSRK